MASDQPPILPRLELDDKFGLPPGQGEEEKEHEGSSRDAEESGAHSLDVLAVQPQQHPTRYIGALEILSVGWSICNSWLGVAATLSLVLAQGGSVTLLYGVLVIAVMYLCIVFTMAELASVYPSAGGQYHWTYILCPPRYSRVISYACGMINVFSWIAIVAGVCLILAEIVLAIVIFNDPSYVPKTWHTFILYQGFNIIIILHNMFTLRHSMWAFVGTAGLSLAIYIIIIITCVARAPARQSNEFVWTEFINMTGWTSSGVVFLVGLISPNYMYAGIDGAIHLAEECTNAATAVPRALIATWVIGFVTTFSFSIAMMYSITDFTTVLETPTGFPVYEIWAQAARSNTAATVFLVVGLCIGIMANVGCEQTASRLTWAFARDNALLGSGKLGHMHKNLQAPCWALLANGFVVLVMGCIYLGSSTAFNALIGTGNILQLLTFAFPAAMLLLRKRSSDFLPPDRGVKLPSVVGWTVNLVSVVFAVVALVFYDFPSFQPVKAGNMNYACAVIGIMAIFAAINWFLWARKHYHGPAIDIDLLRKNE